MSTFVYPRELVFGLAKDDPRRAALESAADTLRLPRFVARNDATLRVTIASPQQAYQFGLACGRLFLDLKEVPLPDAP